MSFASMHSLPAIFFWMSWRWIPMEPSGFLISCATPAASVVRDARLSARRRRASLERFSVTSSMCATLPCTLPSRTSGRRLTERIRGGLPSSVNSRSATLPWLRRVEEKKSASSRSARQSHRSLSMMSSMAKGTEPLGGLVVQHDPVIAVGDDDPLREGLQQHSQQVVLLRHAHDQGPDLIAVHLPELVQGLLDELPHPAVFPPQRLPAVRRIGIQGLQDGRRIHVEGSTGGVGVPHRLRSMLKCFDRPATPPRRRSCRWET